MSAEQPSTGPVSMTLRDGPPQPRPDQPTAQSAMARFAATLVANQDITMQTNADTHPLYKHQLSAAVLFLMLQNIIRPIVYEMHRVLGAQTTVNANDVNILNAIIDSASFDALYACHALMYYKAQRISGTLSALFTSTPRVGNMTYPSYVAALIMSLGPIQFDSVPFRGTHCPFISMIDINNLRPANYGTHQTAKFIEQCTRSKRISTSVIDLLHQESSSWWTFHAYEKSSATTSPSNNHKVFELWSPVKFDDCDQALKLGALFANNKITIGPGPVNFSTSPYYDLNDPPRKTALPQAAHEYPIYNKMQPAVYSFFERAPDFDSDTTMSVAGSSTTGPTTRNNKRRALDDGSYSYADDTSVVMHRIVYLYFDHIAVTHASTFELEHWARQLNETS